ncbi:MAG TPA: PKD domain-containing protein [Actinomycetota bacterium]
MFVVSALSVIVIGTALPASANLPDTSTPSLELDRTITTQPFVGSSTTMRDGEGSAYVTPDGSLWLTEDHENLIFETNPHTGALKRVIDNAAFQNAPLFGGGPVAGPNRTDDFESMAYDEANDWLFVFSGPCCDASHLPTVFRLVRVGGVLQVDSYQPLAATANNTASAWNPADQTLYVGQGQQIRTYDYVTNTTGTAFTVTGLSGILGFSFSSPADTGGSDLFVVTNAERLRRVDWATKTLVPGWTFELTPFEVFDSRAVELIDEQFYVLDGYDSRPPGPLRFAVFVFDVIGPQPVAPVASFTATPTNGSAPLSVDFDDTSTNNPTSWAWDFETDGTVDSTAQNPTHVYQTPATYTATLTATNGAGSDTETAQITVTQAVAPVASFTATPSTGDAPLSVGFTDTSTGNPTVWAWDFESNGSVDSTSQNPTHVYTTPATYTATLTVTNGAGSDTETAQITVNPPAPPTNLVGNPGFDVDTAGWSTAGSGTLVTLTRVTPGRDGTGGAAHLVNGATGKRKCVLNDQPNWVTTTTAGTYTSSIWVRGDAAGALIKINIREMNGSTVVKSRVGNFTLTTAWQQITVSHSILSPGSTLDLQVFLPKAQAPPGTCFYADDASIVRS